MVEPAYEHGYSQPIVRTGQDIIRLRSPKGLGPETLESDPAEAGSQEF
ncbi:MAG: hypothetical protein Phyf2KO_08330 [Phycisphaerales bacterium]